MLKDIILNQLLRQLASLLWNDQKEQEKNDDMRKSFLEFCELHAGASQENRENFLNALKELFPTDINKQFTEGDERRELWIEIIGYFPGLTTILGAFGKMPEAPQEPGVVRPEEQAKQTTLQKIGAWINSLNPASIITGNLPEGDEARIFNERITPARVKAIQLIILSLLGIKEAIVSNQEIPVGLIEQLKLNLYRLDLEAVIYEYGGTSNAFYPTAVKYTKDENKAALLRFVTTMIRRSLLEILTNSGEIQLDNFTNLEMTPQRLQAFTAQFKKLIQQSADRPMRMVDRASMLDLMSIVSGGPLHRRKPKSSAPLEDIAKFHKQHDMEKCWLEIIEPAQVAADTVVPADDSLSEIDNELKSLSVRRYRLRSLQNKIRQFQTVSDKSSVEAVNIAVPNLIDLDRFKRLSNTLSQIAREPENTRYNQQVSSLMRKLNLHVNLQEHTLISLRSSMIVLRRKHQLHRLTINTILLETTSAEFVEASAGLKEVAGLAGDFGIPQGLEAIRKGLAFLNGLDVAKLDPEKAAKRRDLLNRLFEANKALLIAQAEREVALQSAAKFFRKKTEFKTYKECAEALTEVLESYKSAVMSQFEKIAAIKDHQGLISHATDVQKFFTAVTDFQKDVFDFDYVSKYNEERRARAGMPSIKALEDSFDIVADDFTARNFEGLKKKVENSQTVQTTLKEIDKADTQAASAMALLQKRRRQIAITARRTEQHAGGAIPQALLPLRRRVTKLAYNLQDQKLYNELEINQAFIAHKERTHSLIHNVEAEKKEKEAELKEAKRDARAFSWVATVWRWVGYIPIAGWFWSGVIKDVHEESTRAQMRANKLEKEIDEYREPSKWQIMQGEQLKRQLLLDSAAIKIVEDVVAQWNNATEKTPELAETCISLLENACAMSRDKNILVPAQDILVALGTFHQQSVQAKIKQDLLSTGGSNVQAILQQANKTRQEILKLEPFSKEISTSMISAEKATISFAQFTEQQFIAYMQQVTDLDEVPKKFQSFQDMFKTSVKKYNEGPARTMKFASKIIQMGEEKFSFDQLSPEFESEIADCINATSSNFSVLAVKYAKRIEAIQAYIPKQPNNFRDMYSERIIKAFAQIGYSEVELVEKINALLEAAKKPLKKKPLKKDEYDNFRKCVVNHFVKQIIPRKDISNEDAAAISQKLSQDQETIEVTIKALINDLNLDVTNDAAGVESLPKRFQLVEQLRQKINVFVSDEAKKQELIQLLMQPVKIKYRAIDTQTSSMFTIILGYMFESRYSEFLQADISGIAAQTQFNVPFTDKLQAFLDNAKREIEALFDNPKSAISSETISSLNQLNSIENTLGLGVLTPLKIMLKNKLSLLGLGEYNSTILAILASVRKSGLQDLISDFDFTQLERSVYFSAYDRLCTLVTDKKPLLDKDLQVSFTEVKEVINTIMTAGADFTDIKIYSLGQIQAITEYLKSYIKQVSVNSETIEQLEKDIREIIRLMEKEYLLDDFKKYKTQLETAISDRKREVLLTQSEAEHLEKVEAVGKVLMERGSNFSRFMTWLTGGGEKIDQKLVAAALADFEKSLEDLQHLQTQRGAKESQQLPWEYLGSEIAGQLETIADQVDTDISGLLKLTAEKKPVDRYKAMTRLLFLMKIRKSFAIDEKHKDLHEKVKNAGSQAMLRFKEETEENPDIIEGVFAPLNCEALELFHEQLPKVGVMEESKLTELPPSHLLVELVELDILRELFKHLDVESPQETSILSSEKIHLLNEHLNFILNCIDGEFSLVDSDKKVLKDLGIQLFNALNEVQNNPILSDDINEQLQGFLDRLQNNPTSEQVLAVIKELPGNLIDLLPNEGEASFRATVVDFKYRYSEVFVKQFMQVLKASLPEGGELTDTIKERITARLEKLEGHLRNKLYALASRLPDQEDYKVFRELLLVGRSKPIAIAKKTTEESRLTQQQMQLARSVYPGQVIKVDTILRDLTGAQILQNPRKTRLPRITLQSLAAETTLPSVEEVQRRVKENKSVVVDETLEEAIRLIHSDLSTASDWVYGERQHHKPDIKPESAKVYSALILAKAFLSNEKFKPIQERLDAMEVYYLRRAISWQARKAHETVSGTGDPKHTDYQFLEQTVVRFKDPAFSQLVGALSRKNPEHTKQYAGRLVSNFTPLQEIQARQLYVEEQLVGVERRLQEVQDKPSDKQEKEQLEKEKSWLETEKPRLEKMLPSAKDFSEETPSLANWEAFIKEWMDTRLGDGGFSVRDVEDISLWLESLDAAYMQQQKQRPSYIGLHPGIQALIKQITLKKDAQYSELFDALYLHHEVLLKVLPETTRTELSKKIADANADFKKLIFILNADREQFDISSKLSSSDLVWLAQAPKKVVSGKAVEERDISETRKVQLKNLLGKIAKKLNVENIRGADKQQQEDAYENLHLLYGAGLKLGLQDTDESMKKFLDCQNAIFNSHSTKLKGSLNSYTTMSVSSVSIAGSLLMQASLVSSDAIKQRLAKEYKNNADVFVQNVQNFFSAKAIISGDMKKYFGGKEKPEEIIQIIIKFCDVASQFQKSPNAFTNAAKAVTEEMRKILGNQLTVISNKEFYTNIQSDENKKRILAHTLLLCKQIGTPKQKHDTWLSVLHHVQPPLNNMAQAILQCLADYKVIEVSHKEEEEAGSFEIGHLILDFYVAFCKTCLQSLNNHKEIKTFMDKLVASKYLSNNAELLAELEEFVRSLESTTQAQIAKEVSKNDLPRRASQRTLPVSDDPVVRVNTVLEALKQGKETSTVFQPAGRREQFLKDLIAVGVQAQIITIEPEKFEQGVRIKPKTKLQWQVFSKLEQEKVPKILLEEKVQQKIKVEIIDVLIAGTEVLRLDALKACRTSALLKQLFQETSIERRIIDAPAAVYEDKLIKEESVSFNLPIFSNQLFVISMLYDDNGESVLTATKMSQDAIALREGKLQELIKTLQYLSSSAWIAKEWVTSLANAFVVAGKPTSNLYATRVYEIVKQYAQAGEPPKETPILQVPGITITAGGK